MPDDEVELTGGHTSVVVRVGETVRRRTGHWTPAVHALLDHLASVGFDPAPRVLGTDEQGREVLTYLPGEVGLFPLSPWWGTDDAVVAVGRWLRRFHTAQAGFDPDPLLPWRMAPGRRLRPGEVVCHNDAAPYNAIRRPGGELVVIDWDFCAPGDPLEDLAFTAWTWIPLWDAETAARQFGVEPADVPRRLRLLTDAYRATHDQRGRLLDVCRRRMLHQASDIEALAAGGDPVFRNLRDDGVAANARGDARRLEQHRAGWQAALDAGAAAPGHVDSPGRS